MQTNHVIHLYVSNKIYAQGSMFDSAINRTISFFMNFDTKQQALSHLSGIRDNDDGFEFQLVIHSKA